MTSSHDRNLALRQYATMLDAIVGVATRDNLSEATCNERATGYYRQAADYAALLFSGSDLVRPVHFWKVKIAAERWDAEARYAFIFVAVNSPHYAYTTSGHPVAPDQVHVYHSNKRSPTGVSHVVSISEKDERGMAILAAAGRHASTAGGQASGGPS